MYRVTKKGWIRPKGETSWSRNVQGANWRTGERSCYPAHSSCLISAHILETSFVNCTLTHHFGFHYNSVVWTGLVGKIKSTNPSTDDIPSTHQQMITRGSAIAKTQWINAHCTGATWTNYLQLHNIKLQESPAIAD